MRANERFVNACLNKEVDRPPVWMMRQAGRYLPDYRVLKEKHATKEMMQTPEIACEVTLQPISIVGVDAAILYSDILMIPDAMGMGLQFAVGEGPVFDFAIDNLDALNRLNVAGVIERLDYVFQTVKLCIKKLPKDFPLIGFAGAPFTVACYMISGGSSKKDFANVKTFAWTQPQVYQTLLNLITDATIDYLKKQSDAGVVAVQLFDTWAGLLSPEDYRVLAQPYTNRIFAALNSSYVPCIHYIKGGSYLLSDMLSMKSDVIGLDWRVNLSAVRDATRASHAIQGNFDPDLLMSTPDTIQARVKDMIDQVANPCQGYIINLGHGIGQHTPVRNAKYFVECAKSYFK